MMVVKKFQLKMKLKNMNSLYMKSRGHPADFPKEYLRVFNLSSMSKLDLAKLCNISYNRFRHITTSNGCRMDKTEFRNIKKIYTELKSKYDKSEM